MAQQTIKICTGCGRLNTQPLGLNTKKEPYLACCPDNNYKDVTAIEWLEMTYHIREKFISASDFEQAKAMEKEQMKGMYVEGGFAQMRYFDGKEFITGEQYYNETYNK